MALFAIRLKMIGTKSIPLILRGRLTYSIISMKSFKILSTTLFALLLFSASVSAQVDMTWDTHGVGFKVPRGFVIETNNAEEFSAGNDNVFVTIAPIQDENITDDALAAVVAA